MKKTLLFTAMVVALILFSCKSQSSNVEIYNAKDDAKEKSTENRVESDQVKMSYDLTSQLRGMAGVKIKGSGASAEISIRGNNSLGLSNEPLFVIDGVQFNGEYSRLYYSINTNQIKSITVLKDVASTGFYGVNGANGVIEIKLKN